MDNGQSLPGAQGRGTEIVWNDRQMAKTDSSGMLNVYVAGFFQRAAYAANMLLRGWRGE